MWFSMTAIADINDKWAAYAGPGGWNGRVDIHIHMLLTSTLTRCLLSSTHYDRSRYVRSWKRGNDLPGVSVPFQHLGFDEGTTYHWL